MEESLSEEREEFVVTSNSFGYSLCSSFSIDWCFRDSEQSDQLTFNILLKFWSIWFLVDIIQPTDITTSDIATIMFMNEGILPCTEPLRSSCIDWWIYSFFLEFHYFLCKNVKINSLIISHHSWLAIYFTRSDDAIEMIAITHRSAPIA